MFPSLRGEIDWWKCRSRSSPSILQRSKSLGGGIGRYQGNELATMEERESKGCWEELAGWRKVEEYLYPSQKKSRCSPLSPEFPVWEAGNSGLGGNSGATPDLLRPQNSDCRHVALFAANPDGPETPATEGGNSGASVRKLRGNSGPTPASMQRLPPSGALCSKTRMAGNSGPSGRKLRPSQNSRTIKPEDR